MGYTGTMVPIILGQGGLHTDDSSIVIPPTDLIKANNVTIFNNQIEKMAGSTKYNTTPLSDELVSIVDWFPTPNVQRLIAVTADGKVYRDTGDKTFTGGVAIESSLGSLNPNVVAVTAGNETASDDKKLFLFTGTNQVKVLAGDAAVFTDIADPAADWTVNYPKGGFSHRGRLFAFLGHNVYASMSTNHEDFVDATSLLFNVFPGEGDEIIAGFVFKGRAFVAKSPNGIYFLNDQDTDPDNWYFQKLSSTFGISSTNGFVQALDDMLVGNTTRSITSMRAADTFGDIESGDILSILRIENFIREETSTGGTSTQHALYYEEKKMALFTYRSTVGTANDRILYIDLNKPQQPRAVFSDKDQASCLGLRRGVDNVKVPMYGNSDGYIYLMDRADRNVGGVAYTGEFQLPYMDFGFVDQSLINKRKIFDFIEVTFAPEGSWNLSIDVYIDEEFSETIEVPMIVGARYDSAIFDTDRFSYEEPQPVRKTLHGSGRRISLRCYNSGLDETFKVMQIGIGFRPADEGQVR